MTTPPDWSSAKPIHILHSYTLMIRKTFCYSIDLRVVAQPVLARPPEIFPLQGRHTLERPDRPNSTKSPRSETSLLHRKVQNVPEKAVRKRPPPKRIAENDSSHTPARWLSADSIPARRPASPNQRRKKMRRLTKRAMVLDLMRRPNGASVAEIAAVTGWQAHTVRAFISTLVKDNQFRIASTKNKEGVRVYTISEPPRR